MTVHITPQQAESSLRAIEARIENASGILRRLNRLEKPSKRLEPTKQEIKDLRLVIAAIREAFMLDYVLDEDIPF